MKRFLTGLLPILLLGGCSGEGTREEIRPTEEPLPNNQTEQSPEDASDPVVEFTFEREAVFGPDDEVIMGEIAVFTADDSRRVFIGDASQTTIHVFDEDGSYLTSFGREGEGPGEFGYLSPYTTIKVHSGQLYITDNTRFITYRIHVFSLDDFSLSHTIRLTNHNWDNYIAENKGERDELRYHPQQIYPLHQERFLVSYHRFPDEYRENESKILYVVQDNSGTIVSDPVLEQKDLRYLAHTDRTNLTMMYSFPFHGKSLLAVSGSGQLYAANHTETFDISVYDTEGRQIRSFQHPFDNIPLTRSSLMEKYRDDEDAARLGDGVALNMIREEENLPESWPAVDDLLIDDENRLWISTIVEDFDVYEWWVLEETGELITRFEWPRDEPIEVIKNGYIYTRETDEETGLQQVVRYRIEVTL